MKNFTAPGVGTIAVLLAILLVLLLSGCASHSGFANPEARRVEIAWQTLAAYDTAQTVTIARSPTCFRESNKLASAIYGSDNPSPQRVLATNAALAWAHWELGAWLDRRTQAAIDSDNPNRGLYYVGRTAFYVTSFLGSGIAVGNNVSLGIKPFSRRVCP